MTTTSNLRPFLNKVLFFLYKLLDFVNVQGISNFTEDEIQNLRDIFDLFDKDHSGRIEMRDLEAIMNSLQRDPSEAKEMLRSVDPNHDGTITFEEFLNMM